MDHSFNSDNNGSDNNGSDTIEQPQYRRHLGRRRNRQIDSDFGTIQMSSSSSFGNRSTDNVSLQQPPRRIAPGTTADTTTNIPETNVLAPGGWAVNDGTEILAAHRRPLARRRILNWVLHFIKVVVLSIIVILLLVAVGDNGMPAHAGKYDSMEFDWQLDPRSYLKPMNPNFTQYNILLDAHLHTTYSDGVLSPKQAVEFALANGYNAVIVTDHQTVDGALAARAYAEEHLQGRMTVIPGMEYTCCRIHMNLIGINESVPVHPPSPSDAELKAVIDKVHGMGGLVIVNHIPWSNTTVLPWDAPRLPNHPTREQLLDWGVDGFEVVNQNTVDLRSYQFVQEHSSRLVGLTGSDMHYPGSSYAWTTINAKSTSAKDILDEIRARRTSFLLDASGTRPVQDPPYSQSYFRYAPWGLLGDYFHGYADRSRGMYSFQGTFCQEEVLDIHNTMIGWFFLWLIVSIVVLEILYWFFRWLILLLVRLARRRR
ncbi:Polymerase/histidinol phosphatase-like protein [Kickxella alabastrina]|uniref:Polymerase/histidinol phosphatase-like protein n=1 Tax=Kickxella alabastrina TaxID=61397 RepID=UPI00221FD21D|nr:Polymerase/histidinol phosphatase-like protein [Kickxella alabastrina]KAI7826813.1 Polymerase/histidinol phosphatase-like protein [Kickxella alabastrina]